MESNNQQSSAIMELGEGPHHSYAQDYSSFKRKAFESQKRVMEEAIAKSFDPNMMVKSSNSAICIADLACSTGPHTFVAIETIIEAIQNRYRPHPIPELHVFFNNQLSNDLNKLFSYLPPNRPYFASAVPGCFRRRLFPKRTLHFVHSATSLHWLAQVPKQVRERGSRAWNRGRIHHTNAAKEVREAYEAEYEEEFERFLSARAEEIVDNGLMLLHIPTVPDEVVDSDSLSDQLLLPNRVFDLLGSALVDMAQAGIITEEKVDSFNIPIFYSSVKGVTDIVDRNEWFSVEKMEAMTLDKFYAVPNANKFVSLYRSVMQNLIETHFGAAILDELFDRFTQKVEENPDILNPNNLKVLMLFVLLKRKLDPY